MDIKAITMTDITCGVGDAVHIEFRVRSDKRVVWLSVDGVCVFRACRIPNNAVIDIVWDKSLHEFEDILSGVKKGGEVGGLGKIKGEAEDWD